MAQTTTMLASLSISQWTARKQDKKVTAEVESQHGAHNSGNFNKALVNKGLLEPISKIVGRARDAHYHSTLPWSDNGQRILPSKLFMSYCTTIRALKAEFDTAVSTMVQQYPAEVQAARNRLGSMYDPGDYPDPSDIRHKFSLGMEFMPMPDAEDFRVDVAKEVQEELKANLTHAVVLRQAKAMESCYARLRDVVSKFEERMVRPDAIFKDSLITNIKDECTIMDGLNISNDPELTALVKDIADRLIIPPSVLRTNAIKRESAAVNATVLLQRIP
jgi:hypothetical protein